MGWLVHPSFHGAAYLWFGHVKKHHEKLDQEHHHRLLGMLGPLGKEADVAAAKQNVKEAKENLKEAKEAHESNQSLKEKEKAVMETKEELNAAEAEDSDDQ